MSRRDYRQGPSRAQRRRSAGGPGSRGTSLPHYPGATRLGTLQAGDARRKKRPVTLPPVNLPPDRGEDPEAK